MEFNKKDYLTFRYSKYRNLSLGIMFLYLFLSLVFLWMDIRWFKINMHTFPPMSNIIWRIIPVVWIFPCAVVYISNNKLKKSIYFTFSTESLCQALSMVIMLISITEGMRVRNDISDSIRWSTYILLLTAMSIIYIGLPRRISYTLNIIFMLITLTSPLYINYIDKTEDIIMGLICCGVNFVFITVFNKELREEFNKKLIIDEMAYKDNLTGCYNRNYVQTKILTPRGDLKVDKAGILMIDIDHFKKFNDFYGHEIGDRVLKQVAQSILQSIKSSDILLRFGGEEFVAVLLDIDDYDYIETVAKRIHDRIDVINDLPEKITVSIGGTIYSKGMSFYKNVSIADKALYMVKDAGRNATFIYA